MEREKSLKTANLLLLLLSLLGIMHILLLIGVIPQGVVWGGQLKNQEDLFQMESISLVVTFFFALIVFFKIKSLRNGKKSKILSILLYIIAIFFLINTFTNLFSPVLLERLIFTPVSITMAVLSFILGREK